MLTIPTLSAAELFGIQLASAKHDDLANAAKQAGVSLVREGGESKWFDEFDSKAVLAGTNRLYLGYVKRGRQFAFAEYEFLGIDPSPILMKLKRKYGKPSVRPGKYISDKRYQWMHQGIEITLGIDWPNYLTRLSYIEPNAMAALRQERRQVTVGSIKSEGHAY